MFILTNLLLIKQPCPSGQDRLKITLRTDKYGGETSWEIFDSNDASFESGPATSFEGYTTYTLINQCVDRNDACSFTIKDSFGDGMCCSYGVGTYRIERNGVLIAEGGEFGYDETIEMCDGTFTDSPTASPSGSPTAPTVSPSGSPTNSPTASPTGAPTPQYVCEDDSDWYFITNKGKIKYCNYVANRPGRRCSKKSPDNVSASDGCPVACGTCTPSPTDSPVEETSESPTGSPTGSPSSAPTEVPSVSPSGAPTETLSRSPTGSPSSAPSQSPTVAHSGSPTETHSGSPTGSPSASPSRSPSASPTETHSGSPTGSPSGSPTGTPSSTPSRSPSGMPSESPTSAPTAFSCTGTDEMTVQLSLLTDDKPMETSWSLVDWQTNTELHSGGGYNSPGFLDERQFCVKTDGCYIFALNDSGEDGLTSGTPPGSYNLSILNGNVLVSNGGDFQTLSQFTIFGTCSSLPGR